VFARHNRARSGQSMHDHRPRGREADGQRSKIVFDPRERSPIWFLRLRDGVEDADRGHRVVRRVDHVVTHEPGTQLMMGTAPSSCAVPGSAFTWRMAAYMESSRRARGKLAKANALQAQLLLHHSQSKLRRQRDLTVGRLNANIIVSPVVRRSAALRLLGRGLARLQLWKITTCITCVVTVNPLVPIPYTIKMSQ